MKLLNPGNASDRDRWLCLWQASGREPFAHPGYVELYAGGEAQARCALYESYGGQIFYPFLLRSIPKAIATKPAATPAFDIISPYGYGGPLLVEKPTDKGVPEIENNDPSIQKEQKTALFSRFYREFHLWARNNNVVSEFVRFYLFSEAREHYYGLVESPIQNVVVDLQPPLDAIRKNLPYNVRRNIRIAEQSGLHVVEDPWGSRLDDHLHVYYDTMKRRRAKAFYFFPKEWFERLMEQMPGCFTFFHTMHKDTVVASELVLTANNRAYSFLSSTLREHFNLRPAHLLKHHIIQWAKNKAYSELVLGGGQKPNDGIYAFKKSFAPKGIAPFHTGKMIFDEKTYQALSGKTTYEGFFPAYRNS